MSSVDDRHLTPAGLLEHWSAGVPALIPLRGDPPLALLIDPQAPRLVLRAPIDPQASPAPSRLMHVSTAIAVIDGARVLEVMVRDERLLLDGYAMLGAIADRVQLDGMPALQALDETIRQWRDVLAARVRLSPESEVGLLGELLVLGVLVSQGLGLESWRGPLAEEHDFGLGDADVEVKTTSGERRQHWISSLTQLVPTGRTPLWLVSLQVTRANEPHPRLPEVVESLASSLPAQERNAFLLRLRRAGWDEDQTDLYSDRWRLRTAPLAYLVNDEFPAVTPKSLHRAGLDEREVRAVRYKVDLTGRPAAGDPPSLLRATIDRLRDTLDQ